MKPASEKFAWIHFLTIVTSRNNIQGDSNKLSRKINNRFYIHPSSQTKSFEKASNFLYIGMCVNLQETMLNRTF